MSNSPSQSLDALPGIDADMLHRLLAGERVPFAAPAVEENSSHDEQQVLTEAGLIVADGMIWLERTSDRLDMTQLRAGLRTRARALWPQTTLLDSVGSTNAELMAAGAAAAGQLVTTEFQFGGRGRRGRSWVSPIGRNLAVSLGWGLPGGLQQFAGLSLVVGLAVVDALRTLGLEDVWLKWPNDILVARAPVSSAGANTDSEEDEIGEFAKLGGILVELQQHADSSVAVIGVGLNHGGAAAVRRHVDQPLGDITELDAKLTRTQVLAAVVSALADYLEQFAEHGFAPMVPVWESLHAYAGKEVNILRGEVVTAGRVVGVTPSGALRVTTDAGEQQLDAGEVSLRIRGQRTRVADD